MDVRRLLALAALAWVGRWALLELASYVGSRFLRPGPPPNRSPRQPGVMPGPDLARVRSSRAPE